MKTLLTIVCFVLSSTGYADVGDIKSRNDAAEYAISITKQYKLTTLRIECLLFNPDKEEKAFYWVSVLEYHTPECGGIPEVAPTVFFLHIWKKGGRVTTDAYHRLEFLPVREAAMKMREEEKKEAEKKEAEKKVKH